MKYYFVLGNNPALSVAEILAVLKPKEAEALTGRLISENIFVTEIQEEIDASSLIKKMGGTIKIGVIGEELKIKNTKEILRQTIRLIDEKNIEGKFRFGISYYGKGRFNEKPLAMEIKKYLKEKGVASRWVISREPTLSSVVVEQNKLIGDKGLEIVVLEDGGGALVGQTLSVQPFKELSFRDYGRPARDDRSGMLPPKLAQIMINLATASSINRNEEIILDPFCGSGTILTEAMLMNYKNIIGSDISLKAIDDTKKNIDWIKNNYQASSINYQLFNKNILELSKFIEPNSVDAIATEPYLGPQRGEMKIEKIKKELEDLYSKGLAEFKKVLKPGGRVAMVWPEFHASRIIHRLSPNLNGLKIINPIPENFKKNKLINLTSRSTIIYGRPGQKVWREIVVLEKIYEN